MHNLESEVISIVKEANQMLMSGSDLEALLTQIREAFGKHRAGGLDREFAEIIRDDRLPAELREDPAAMEDTDSHGAHRVSLHQPAPPSSSLHGVSLERGIDTAVRRREITDRLSDGSVGSMPNIGPGTL